MPGVGEVPYLTNTSILALDTLRRRGYARLLVDGRLPRDGPVEAAEYVNHSCSPNVGVHGQMSLVALRDIARLDPGEAADVARWAIQALIDAALAEAGG